MKKNYVTKSMLPSLSCNALHNFWMIPYWFFFISNAFVDPQGICFILLFQTEFKKPKKTKRKGSPLSNQGMEKVGEPHKTPPPTNREAV